MKSAGDAVPTRNTENENWLQKVQFVRDNFRLVWSSEIKFQITELVTIVLECEILDLIEVWERFYG